MVARGGLLAVARFDRHGWLQIPGLQPKGDRTIEEQMLGLAPALFESKGKTVFDIGCAEGAISLAFLNAGASDVYAVDLHEPHLQVAKVLCKAREHIVFERANLHELAVRPVTRRFDIVLALGVIHKLWEPWLGGEFALRSCRGLLCLRPPGGAHNGIIRSKGRVKNKFNFHEMAKEHGFTLERVEPSTRNEIVEYWRAPCE